MASYKVAQDVEADDKLLGPFTFRQVIYLGIVAMCCGICYFLWQLLPPLAIIPMPVILFFGALALPLRKDQPMETYLAAMLSYYLKSHKRLWVPDGLESIVQVTAPRTEEENRVKTLGGVETERRLAYLATLVDTGGWSIRNAPYASVRQSASPMNQDAYNAAQQVSDPLDDSGKVATSFDRMIDAADSTRRREAMNMMRSPSTSAAPIDTQQTTPPASVQQSVAQSQAQQPSDVQQSTPPQSEPTYVVPTMPQSAPATSNNGSDVQGPTDQQKVVASQDSPAPATTSEPPVTQDRTQDEPRPANDQQSASISDLTPDIMELANNKDLSVETMQREVHRTQTKKKRDKDEVVISLR